MKLKTPSSALVVACVAFLVALGPAVRAADTVFSTDIVDLEVKTADIATAAVIHAKLGPNAVRTVNVLNESLTSADLRGANINRGISLAAGAVANGSCKDVFLAAAGAAVGEAVLVSLRGPAPEGLLLQGVRVPSANQVIVKICNLAGAPSPQISLPIRVMTFG